MKLMQSVYLQRIIENAPLSGEEKTKPIQTQYKPNQTQNKANNIPKTSIINESKPKQSQFSCS